MEAELETLLPDLLDLAVSVKLYYRPHGDLGGMVCLNARCKISLRLTALADIPSLFMKRQIPVTPVPCTFVASYDRDDWDYAICIIEA